MPEVLAKNAAAFDQLGDSVDSLPVKFNQAAVGFTAAMAPQIQVIADRILAIDFVPVGAKLGKRTGRWIEIPFRDNQPPRHHVLPDGLKNSRSWPHRWRTT